MFLGALARDPRMTEIAATPLLLTLLCLEYQQSPATPADRAAFYDNGVDILLRACDASRGLRRARPPDLTVSRLRKLYSSLAARYFYAARLAFERADLEQTLSEVLRDASNSRKYGSLRKRGTLVRPGVLALLGLLLTQPAIAQTALVSVAPGGGPAQGGASGQNAVAISGDGRVVAFESAAVNLVAGDTNTLVDVFVYDRFTRTTSRVSVATGGTQAAGGASGGSGIALSGNGQIVAFTSTATNLVAGDSNGIADVFVHDRATGITTRVSVASDGAQGQGVGARRRPSLSADGRFVAFDSEMTNLVPGDTNAKSDVFVHDRVTGQTTRVSVATGGAQATGDFLGSLKPSLSADGRFVAFVSDALNLVSGDTNNFLDAFVHDRATGVTTRVSVQSGGGQAGGGDSFNVAISADGRYAAFDSEANVVPGDTNGDRDVFVHDRVTGEHGARERGHRRRRGRRPLRQPRPRDQRRRPLRGVRVRRHQSGGRRQQQRELTCSCTTGWLAAPRGSASRAPTRSRRRSVAPRRSAPTAASWPSGRTPPTSPTATRTSSTTCSCATPGCSSASGSASRQAARSCRGRPRDARR